jgi:cytochrome c1
MKMRAKSLGLALCAAALSTTPVLAAGEGIAIDRKTWSFSGPAGHFDKNQLQRGFMVYKNVCASCHGINRIAFRNLTQKGGPEFPEAGVRSLAASYKIKDLDEKGEPIERPGRLSDRFPPPYANDLQARARNNEALPPDLSLIAKGRGVSYTGSLWYHPISMLKDVVTGYQEGGADYIYALMTGYKEKAPAYRNNGGKLVPVPESEVRDEKSVVRCASIDKSEDGTKDVCNPLSVGMSYNAYFPGHQIGMAAPLEANDSRLKYTDGTPTTLSNYAADVAAFLAWTADPTHDQRKDMGWQVLLYLLVTAVLLFVAKKRIWRDAH